MTQKEKENEFLKDALNFEQTEDGFAKIGIYPYNEGAVERINALLAEIGDYRITDSEPYLEERVMFEIDGSIEEYLCDNYHTNIPFEILINEFIPSYKTWLEKNCNEFC